MLRGFLVAMLLGLAVATVVIFYGTERTPVVGLLLAVCWGLMIAACLLATRGRR